MCVDLKLKWNILEAIVSTSSFNFRNGQMNLHLLSSLSHHQLFWPKSCYWYASVVDGEKNREVWTSTSLFYITALPAQVGADKKPLLLLSVLTIHASGWLMISNSYPDPSTGISVMSLIHTTHTQTNGCNELGQYLNLPIFPIFFLLQIA